MMRSNQWLVRAALSSCALIGCLSAVAHGQATPSEPGVVGLDIEVNGVDSVTEMRIGTVISGLVSAAPVCADQIQRGGLAVELSLSEEGFVSSMRVSSGDDSVDASPCGGLLSERLVNKLRFDPITLENNLVSASGLTEEEVDAALAGSLRIVRCWEGDESGRGVWVDFQVESGGDVTAEVIWQAGVSQELAECLGEAANTIRFPAALGPSRFSYQVQPPPREWR